MADRKAYKRTLRWVEGTLYVAGVALIAVFVYLKTDGERQRVQGLEAFERNLSETVSTENLSVRGNEPMTSLPGDSPFADRLPLPDLEQWDQRRVSAYRESLATPAESPPLAVLNIDHLQVAVPVYDGTDEANLARGAGRIRGTARVGAEGNLGIAAHRDSFFRPLKDIVVGDTVELKTAGGSVTYEVSSIEIVDPEDVSVLAPTAQRTLTLVTCYPFYHVGHAPKRFIVKATAEHHLAKT